MEEMISTKILIEKTEGQRKQFGEISVDGWMILQWIFFRNMA
jgi:hypothetical protein